MIRNHAIECSNLLNSSLKRFDGPCLENARELVGRFNLWASNIGVFSQASMSLDYRLRDAPDIAEAIVGMLTVINIRVCHAVQPSLPYPDDDVSNAPSLEVFPANMLLGTKGDAEGRDPNPRSLSDARTREKKRHRELEGAANAIGRLQRISLAIRKASSASAFSRAASFVIYDTDIIESTGSQQTFQVDFRKFIHTVLSHRYRGLSETHLNKIADLICLRRQRFLHAASHQHRLRGSSHTVKQLAKPPQNSGGSIISEPLPNQHVVVDPGEIEVGGTENDKHSESRASTFNQQNYAPEPTGSVASSQLQVSQALLGNKNIPPAPKIPHTVKEYECPYCHWALPARQFVSKRRWQIHIEQDLQPYMCLYEECFNPPRLFTSVEKWILHTNEQHSSHWVCLLHPETADHLPSFNGKEDLEDHLRSAHGGSLSASQVKTLVRRGTRHGIASIFRSCPFCKDYSAQGSFGHIQEHIASHLLDLALMSLPWRDDIDETAEQSEASQIHSEKSTGRANQSSSRGSSGRMDRDLPFCNFEDPSGIEKFRQDVNVALMNPHLRSVQEVEELVDSGRNFNVDIPEVESLEHILRHMKWNDDARRKRDQYLTLRECQELILAGEQLGLSDNNDHLLYFKDLCRHGETWEEKAKELMSVEAVHYQQLKALSAQASQFPVSPDTLAAVDAILIEQREAQKRIQTLYEQSKDPDFRKRPEYKEVRELMDSLEQLNSRPIGAIDLEREQKRHEDWMRKGKKLFGKANAPLHILKSHMEYVEKRNAFCFDLEDRCRPPVEPTSRDNTPEGLLESNNSSVWGGGKSRKRDVFCICRKSEAGMMIECEVCHEWYHGKCLKIARGQVKEFDKYTCPICDWRRKIPRDAARPKLEDLLDWQAEIPGLPFQPDEEEILDNIVNQATSFRDFLQSFTNAACTTTEEVPTLIFFLRKIEGAEVLLAYETNFFRQEIHKWAPVAPEPPPVLEQPLSIRNPRPTKQQKIMPQLGVDRPEDLPPHLRLNQHNVGK